MARTNITALSFLAFAFGIVYIVGHMKEIVDIITSYVQLQQRSYMNLSNLVYCLVGVVHLFVPISIMYPHRNITDKTRMLKIVCYTMGILYLLANFWVFQWLFKGLASREFSFDVAQFLKVENMMFCHLQWSSRNAEVIFYNYLTAVLWIGMGYYFNRDRRLTCKLMLAQAIVAYIVPMIFYYFYRGKGIPDWWLKKTIPLMCSDAVLIFCLFYAAVSRETWKRYISPLKRSSRPHRHHHHHHHHHHHSTENSLNK